MAKSKATPANIRHSSGSKQWGTGATVLDFAEYVLNGTTIPTGDRFDFDPFSEPEFNANVRAARFFDGTKGRDSYKDRWFDDERCPRADWLLKGIIGGPELVRQYRPLDPSVALGPIDTSPNSTTGLVNPPGSDDGEGVKNAWRLSVQYHKLGWFGGGLFYVAFNLNVLQTCQRIAEHSPMFGGYLRCIPATRMPFVAHSTTVAARIAEGKDPDAEQPSHPSLVLLMPAMNDRANRAEQIRRFKEAGSVLGEVF